MPITSLSPIHLMLLIVLGAPLLYALAGEIVTGGDRRRAMTPLWWLVIAYAGALGRMTRWLEEQLGARAGWAIGLAISAALGVPLLLLYTLVQLDTLVLTGIGRLARWALDHLGAALIIGYGWLYVGWWAPVGWTLWQVARWRGDTTFSFAVRLLDLRERVTFYHRFGADGIAARYQAAGWMLGTRACADGHLCRFGLSVDGRQASCIWCGTPEPVSARGRHPAPAYYCPVCASRTPRERLVACAASSRHVDRERVLCQDCATPLIRTYGATGAVTEYVCPLHAVDIGAWGGVGREAFTQDTQRIPTYQLYAHSASASRPLGSGGARITSAEATESPRDGVRDLLRDEVPPPPAVQARPSARRRLRPDDIRDVHERTTLREMGDRGDVGGMRPPPAGE